MVREEGRAKTKWTLVYKMRRSWEPGSEAHSYSADRLQKCFTYVLSAYPSKNCPVQTRLSEQLWKLLFSMLDGEICGA